MPALYKRIHVIINPASGKNQPMLNIINDVCIRCGPTASTPAGRRSQPPCCPAPSVWSCPEAAPEGQNVEDHLFNDLSVQQTYLLHIAEVLPAGDAQGKRALMAIGFLVAGARKCVAKPVV